jgi:hypothetical protein
MADFRNAADGKFSGYLLGAPVATQQQLHRLPVFSSKATPPPGPRPASPSHSRGMIGAIPAVCRIPVALQFPGDGRA